MIPETRTAAVVLDELRTAEADYAADKQRLDDMYRPLLAPLRSEMEDLKQRAKEIVTECGRTVVEARASWSTVHLKRHQGCTASGYDSLTDVKITPTTVTVGTRHYCGEGNYEAGAPITFPTRWLDPDSTHGDRCTELRQWYADKAVRIAAKEAAAATRAAIAKELQDRAEYARLHARYSAGKGEV